MRTSLIIVLVLAVAGAVGFAGKDEEAFNWEVATLMLTAVFVAWYTIETQKLREATQESNRLSAKMRAEMVIANTLSIQPGVVINYERGEHGNRYLVVSNIGKGPAINLRIESKSGDYLFDLDTDVLHSGEKRDISLRRKGKDGSADTMITDFAREFDSKSEEATIFFDRIKRWRTPLSTRVEVKHPPNVRILERNWTL